MTVYDTSMTTLRTPHSEFSTGTRPARGSSTRPPTSPARPFRGVPQETHILESPSLDSDHIKRGNESHASLGLSTTVSIVTRLETRLHPRSKTPTLNPLSSGPGLCTPTTRCTCNSPAPSRSRPRASPTSKRSSPSTSSSQLTRASGHTHARLSLVHARLRAG